MLATTSLLRTLAPRLAARAIASSSWRASAMAGDGGGDSHSDFAPVAKGDGAGGVDDTIRADIQGHKVFVYMKGSPDAPQCGFSNMACRILDAYGVPYGSRNVLADPALREGVKAFSEWPTIPQVFVAGEFVGGADILMSMHQSGELAKELEKVK